VRKGKHILGIGLQVRRERMIHRLQERNKRIRAQLNTDEKGPTNDDLPTVAFEEQSDTLPPTLLTQHYHMSVNSRLKVQVLQWLMRNNRDPALAVSFFFLLAI